MWEKTPGPKHPDVATGLNNLAGLYGARGRYADPEPLYKLLQAIQEKANGLVLAETFRALPTA